MERTHTIPAENLGELMTIVKRIARRADKLGVAAPTMTVGELYDTVTPDGTGWSQVQTWVTVTITGTAPTLDGWSVRAVITREPHLDAPHLVHVIDGTMRPEWRTIGDICDHCGLADKGRKTLVVVEHADGTQRIVGSTCVADFAGGIDPHYAAWWLSFSADLAELFDDDRFNGFCNDPGGQPRVMLTHLLTVTAAEIRTNGWLSVTRAQDTGGMPTKDIVLRRIYRPRHDDDAPAILPEDRETAIAAIDWAASLDPYRNDYEANCQAIAVRETVTEKQAGIACSIVASYQRHIGAQAARAARPTSEHVGEIGRRDEFCATVAATMVVDSQFGPAVWVTAVDPAGNVLRWRCSGRAPQTGDTITGKATVKAHDIWQDIRQTVLTRWSWKLA